jgi:hypothetical protein
MVGIFHELSGWCVWVVGADLSMVRVVGPKLEPRHAVCATSPRVKMGRLLSYLGYLFV